MPNASPGPRGHIAGHVALVTGANRGIGREVCRQLAALGYTVVLTARDPAKAAAAAEDLTRGPAPGAGRVVARRLDVTDAASVAAAHDWTAATFGRLDALVNNAGADYDTDQRAATADLDRVRRALEANTLGPWRVAEAFAPLLRRSPRGRLVNVSSEGGSLAGIRSPATPGYTVSKAALNALTRLLAADLGADGVLVNAVCPGWVATDMGGAGGRAVADGAASVVWGVTLPDDGPTGGFFRDGRPLPW